MVTPPSPFPVHASPAKNTRSLSIKKVFTWGRDLKDLLDDPEQVDGLLEHQREEGVAQRHEHEDGAVHDALHRRVESQGRHPCPVLDVPAVRFNPDTKRQKNESRPRLLGCQKTQILGQRSQVWLMFYVGTKNSADLLYVTYAQGVGR